MCESNVSWYVFFWDTLYLNIPSFDKRKANAKFRCSDHDLEIEKGRHKKIPREARLCKLCESDEIESEDHFLFTCNFYEDIKSKLKSFSPMTIYSLLANL